MQQSELHTVTLLCSHLGFCTADDMLRSKLYVCVVTADNHGGCSSIHAVFRSHVTEMHDMHNCGQQCAV
jgi:hypothetical protein